MNIDEVLGKLVEHWLRVEYYIGDPSRFGEIDGFLKELNEEIIVFDTEYEAAKQTFYLNRKAQVVIVSCFDFGAEKPTRMEPKTGMSV